MIKMKRVFWIMSLTGLLIGIVSCTNVNRDGNSNNGSDSLAIVLSEDESVVYLLPSPGEILLRFYSADIPYKPELLNSPANKDKYIGSKAQTLNLGVYITDMAYSALFERPTETVSYLESIQTLSTESGISSTIFESLLERSKANAGQLDSLANISNEAFSNMLEFLESGGKETLVAQISAGAYIESLYLAVQSIDTYSKDNPTLDMLIEMKYPMDNLLEKAKISSAEENDKSIVNYLIQISIIFNELDTNSEETIISQKSGGEISIGGGDEFTMDETSFNNLKNKVSEIRNKIVSF